MFGSRALSVGQDRRRGRRTIACYERELILRIKEEKRLREALSVAEALLGQRESRSRHSVSVTEQANAAVCIATLTPRQHEIMVLVLAGHPTKIIALDLGISRRTVENHRAAIMKKTGSKSLPALGRFGFAALQ